MRNTFLALALAPLAGLLVLVSPLPGVAQPAPAAVLDARPELRQLRDRAERRFEIMQVRRGLILVPKADVPRVRTIEIADGTVLIDGVPVTGRELRERLGDAADTVVQLSFLDADARTALFGRPAERAAPVPPAATESPSPQG
ncbi:MAG: hypothetical protein NTY02_11995, partial [Acidobacteria bacterium]|nr:hypothetical protein [Acidobacteriota bacterium]